MTAIVNVTKLLFKRGNTAQNAAYTGINGEITVDTQAKTLRVHDGVTTGGNIVTAGAMASYIPTDPTITSIQANVAAANAAISAITGIDTSLLANAATQQTQIDVLNANVDTINANIGAFQTYANATATTVANLTNGASTVSLSTDGNLTLPSGGLLGQVYGDGIDTELTIKSPPGVGDSGYVALASANEQNYVEVNNTGIVLGVEFGQAGFKTWTFDTDGVLTAPGNIVLLNGAVIKDTVGGAVAFGVNAGLNSQGIEAIAIGLGAGSDTQGNNAIAIGEAAGNNTQGIEAVAIGRGAGANTQGNRSVAISIGAGATGQSGDAIAIGYNAGTTSQGIAAVAIGQLAGQTSQSGGAVAIGYYAGQDSQSISAVAIGDLAGANTQGNNSVAIGTTAGETSQGDRAVAIGLEAGTTSQGVGGIAIGEQAGHTSQGVLSVAIGYYAGANTQSFSAVAIGAQAGETAQGQHAVAIGDLAGQTAQGNKSIILNATGVALNQTTANTFTVAPVRNDVANVGEVMFYNTTSKEITYGNTISVAGNVSAARLQNDGNLELRSNVAGTAKIWTFRDNGNLTVAGNINFGGDPSAAPSLNDFFSVTSAANFAVTIDSANSAPTWSFAASDSDLGEFDELPLLRTPAGDGSVIYNETLMAILAGNIDAGERSSVRLQEGAVALLGTTSLDGELSTIILEVNTGGVGIRALGDAAPRLSVVGNISGGNILTGGSISATGNLTANNIFTGNVSAGNITTSNLTFPDSTTQTTAFTTSPTLNVLKIDDGVHEKFQTKVDATGVVTHDCSLGHIIYHTSPDDYFTVNLTNLDLASGYATSITVVVEQGATGYGPNALQIGGVAQTINWQGGSLPAAPTANGVDVLVFSILNNSGTYTVLAQVTGFNEVA